MRMFQDKADLLLSLLQRFADDDPEAGEEAGGGGGPKPSEDAGAPEESEAGQAAQADTAGPEDGGQSEPAEEMPEASAGEAPAEHEQEAPAKEKPAGEPEDEFAAAMADQEAFERALAQEGASGQGTVDYSGTFQSLREGDVVQGTIVHIDREGILVDVGTKSEGVIRMAELTRDPFQNPEDVVSVGEQISVYVMQPENQEGTLLLSKKRADFEVAWHKVQEAHEGGKILHAMVSDRVKGGLVVDLGIRGFVPASHVGSGKIKNLDKYIGQSIPLKVIEVDRERKKVVLSNRLAVEEEREKERTTTLAELEEGQVRTGVVRRITDYGAFVDIGGIDGLLHISEMSWTRIRHPSDVVKVGQKIQVMVLKMSPESGRISLGMRQILPDPWQQVGERYNVGDVLNVKISRLVPFGAFVQLEEGIEAIIPNQELSQRRISRPDQVVSVDQDVEARVVDLRPDERRMTLSMRALMHEREIADAPPSAPQHPGREAPRTTVADLLGEQFAEKRAQLEREMERGTKAKSAKRRHEKARAQEKDEEEAYGSLSDEELLDLAVGGDADEEEQGLIAQDDVLEDVAVAEDLAPVAETAEIEEESAEVGAAEEAADTGEEPTVAETSEVDEAVEPDAEAEEPATEEDGKSAS